MKIIGRILILLLAALVVIGITLVVAQTTPVSQALGGSGGGGPDFQREGRQPPNFGQNSPESGAPNGNNPGIPPGEFNNGFEGRHGGRRGMDEGKGGINAFTLSTLAKNLGVIGLIVLVYAGINTLFSHRKAGRSPAAKENPPSIGASAS